MERAGWKGGYDINVPKNLQSFSSGSTRDQANFSKSSLERYRIYGRRRQKVVVGVSVGQLSNS